MNEIIVGVPSNINIIVEGKGRDNARKYFYATQEVSLKPALIVEYTVSEPDPITVSTTEVDDVIYRDSSTSAYLMGTGFTLSNTDATAFQIKNYEPTQGQGFYLASGGLHPNSDMKIPSYVNANKADGIYKGSVVVQYNKYGTWWDGPTVSYSIDLRSRVLASPRATLFASPTVTTYQGARLSNDSVNVTVARGQRLTNVFSFTSIDANQFTLYGYPTSYGPGINSSPSSGGVGVGSTVPVTLEVISTVPAGVYTGRQRLLFYPGQVEKFVNFTVNVVEQASSN